MIYVTGDTHGRIERFTDNNLGDEGWTKDDYLIVCGDFGFIFAESDEYARAREERELDYLEESKPYTICFIDGNHENFPRIFSYPEEEWNGGRIHRIRKNIIHLMRGQVFEIEGRTFFTMGGAYSIDRGFRRLGESYWNEELPCEEEYDEALKNLDRYGKKVDYIITHTAPTPVVREIGFGDFSLLINDLRLTGFLEALMEDVSYGHWYFGHFHTDIDDVLNYGKYGPLTACSLAVYVLE